MAIYSPAIQKPITVSKGRKALTLYNRMNLHVAVSESASLHGAFNRSGQPDSHFYVRKDGTVEQYVDTAYRANADLEGNDATISVETQGGVTKADSEPWTDAQVKALAALFAWAVKTHGIKNQIATTSKTDDTSKGLSWHRLGVDGNFPALPNVGAGRTQRGGGMKYSSSSGKLCPGLGKIKQVPEIFALANANATTTTATATKVSSTATTTKTTTAKTTTKATVKIDEDGIWGSDTTRRVQEILGTTVDGKVSSQSSAWKKANPGLGTGWEWASDAKGSKMIVALQKKLGVDPDGKVGPTTITAFQKKLGTTPDGVISNPSAAVKQLQKNLNNGKIW